MADTGLMRRLATATKAFFGQLQTVESRSGWWWSSAPGSGGWWPIVREPFAGAWQQNQHLALPNILCYAPVYACITLISSDIGKLRVKLVEQDADGVWTETQNPAFSPVLRKPNRFQTRIQFYQWWVTSKLEHGNTYVLKQRDQRGVVTALYVLDATRVKPLVAPDGSVFYDLAVDNLAGLTEADALVVPASEIIHDVMNPLYHPLCGVSPLSACALAALLALKIQRDSINFFENNAQPGGILTAPGFIKDETARRLKETWMQEFSGENAGRVAVLGDGLKFEAMRQNAHDAQLIEQLKWTGFDVCTAFHVPPYKIGIGDPPNFNNIEALNQQYYSECLQVLIESIEILLDEGLGMSRDGAPQAFGTEFDTDELLRMDTATRVKAAADAIGGAGMTINEARKRYFGLPKVAGGDAVYLQQQNFSIEALAERDADDPFATPPAPVAPAPVADDSDDMDEEDAKVLALYFEKALAA